MATKKKAAPAEEVQNTQEGAQNDAQRVEAPQPIEEPTQTTNAPESAKNASEEASAPALTLDMIDELTLPGDVDPDEEQAPQRWSITETGEIVEGVNVTETAPAFSVKF